MTPIEVTLTVPGPCVAPLRTIIREEFNACVETLDGETGYGHEPCRATVLDLRAEIDQHISAIDQLGWDFGSDPNSSRDRRLRAEPSFLRKQIETMLMYQCDDHGGYSEWSEVPKADARQLSKNIGWLVDAREEVMV